MGTRRNCAGVSPEWDIDVSGFGRRIFTTSRDKAIRKPLGSMEFLLESTPLRSIWSESTVAYEETI
jgi:hypothetical protein